jgi:hypothetical protein
LDIVRNTFGSRRNNKQANKIQDWLRIDLDQDVVEASGKDEQKQEGFFFSVVTRNKSYKSYKINGNLDSKIPTTRAKIAIPNMPVL